MVDEPRAGAGEPIAVVGLACRFPGAGDPRSFWRLLRDGLSAVTDVPPDRWLDGPGPRHGGFIPEVDSFDADFFGVSPAEAVSLDPQQRLMLELTWEAIEDAGLVAGDLRGDRTGMFIGVASDDYAKILHDLGHEAADRHTVTGTQRSLIADRTSFTFGWRGPSLCVDAGQASSAVAVHLACESLRRGECVMALAGGVQLNLLAEGAMNLDRLGVLSPDGRCFTFDARANGIVRGEGGGLLVLKPLSSAQADGDTIHCVIAGSAVNHDGPGRTLTTPDPDGQADVIRRACAAAGVEPASLQYVELHGTGTRAGDPVEAAALGAAVGRSRPAGAPLLVGSVKTNIGHLEAAAGIAGLVKTVLSISHRRLPASLNFETPNPAIPFDQISLRVRRELGDWPRPDEPLVAGVSSFSLAGTNCHLILAGVPRSTVDHRAARVGTPAVWPVSGRTRDALRAQARALADWTDDPESVDLDAVARGLVRTRTAFEHRAVVVARDLPGLRRALANVAAGRPDARVVEGITGERGRTVFVFPGQGSQWTEMARTLLRESTVFRDEVEACATALTVHTGWSVGDVLRGRPQAPGMDSAEVIQPVLFAVMAGLTKLWRSVGVWPDAVVGHSQGEVIAAYVAGRLTLDHAARIIVVRSRVGRSIGGALATVGLSAAQVLDDLNRWGTRLSIAAINGPSSTVVSGDSDAIGELITRYADSGVRAGTVTGSYASHSAHVETVEETLRRELGIIRSTAGSTVELYSTVTGGPVDADLDAGYWYRNLRHPVRFTETVGALLRAGYRTFVEVSPHPTLTAAIEDTAAADPATPAVAVVGSLRRGDGTMDRFLLSAARLAVYGTPVAWPGADGRDAPRISLPTYAFQRQRHWPSKLDPTPQATRRTPAVAWAGRLRAMPSTAVRPAIVDLVVGHCAAILGRVEADTVDAGLTLRELGFESATAVELRNRLVAATGVSLASTVTYDHPTPAALAAHLHELVLPDTGSAPGPDARMDERPDGGIDGPIDEPVAIIGCAGRFSGGVTTPERLWQLLIDETDTAADFPRDRGWRVDGLPFAPRGGFLHNAGGFDAAFFGVSAREAAAMDPQHRQLLEVGWEALERAGIDPLSLSGSPTGVYIGLSGPLGSVDDAPQARGYRLTGQSAAVASGRLAYVLGLRGPALTVDTACSSSLVAIHLAAAALRAGECSLAMAGGATVMATPDVFDEFHRQGGLSSDGRCRPFAADADGTGWSEGAGLLVLQRLSDAIHDGRTVLAVIRGSAIGSDGASNGLTAPNGQSQQRVIGQALRRAGLAPAYVDAVEAHGTGTVLGDPIEVQALLGAYGDRPADRPLLIGSVKSNIGHTQAAAGVVGVIKMVEAIRRGVLPRTLHVGEPTPHVDWSIGRVMPLTEAVPWPETGRPRRAGVSSFGISGTNAHLILEQAPAVAVAVAVAVADRPPAEPDVMAWPISAKTGPALDAVARGLRAYVSAHPDVEPDRVARTLATRALLPYRGVVIGADRDELLAGLHQLETGPGSRASRAVAHAGPTAFLFAGQGSQRPGMGRELAERHRLFDRVLGEVCSELDDRLRHHLGEEHQPLREVMFAAAGSVAAELLDRHTAYTQSALFAYQTSLVRLLASYGIRPDYLLGHSIGGIGAACAAGVLTLPDACTLVAARGCLMHTMPPGAMVAISAPPDAVRDALVGAVSIAAYNSPSSVVISGDPARVRVIADQFSERGHRTTTLRTTRAFHSGHTDAIAGSLRDVAETLTYHPPTIPIISEVTGQVAGDELRDPTYWTDHIRQPVRYAEAVAAAHARGVRTYLELAPTPTLAAVTADSLPADDDVVIVATGPEPLAVTLGRWHVRTTAGVTWPRPTEDTELLIDLPTYPFQHERFWRAPSQDAAVRAAHPLAGAVVDLAGDSPRWLRHRLDAAALWYVQAHTLDDVPVLPGAAMVEWALAAARLTGPESTVWTLRDITFNAMLRFPGGAPVPVQAIVEHDGGSARVRCFARTDEAPNWTKHVTVGSAAATAPVPPVVDLPALRRGAVETPADIVTVHLARRGLRHAERLRGIRRLWRRDNEVIALVDVPSADEEYLAHPAVLDSCFQVAAVFTAGDDLLWLPAGVDRMTIHSALPHRLWCHGTWRVENGEPRLDLELVSAEGEHLSTVEGLRLRPWLTDDPSGAPPDGAALTIQDPGAARAGLLDELLHITGSLVGLPATAREVLRPTFGSTRLNTLGLDSLTTVQLRTRLMVEWGVDVAPGLLLGGGTAEEVVDVVCQQLALRRLIVAGEEVADDVEVVTL